MLKVKAHYEQAVENRNVMGLQLIERNDELCILFERASMQEKTSATGIKCLNSKEDEIRMLSVTIMTKMFRGAKLLNLNIYLSKWDVSSVATMSEMFRGATLFNGDVSN